MNMSTMKHKARQFTPRNCFAMLSVSHSLSAKANIQFIRYFYR